MIRAMIFDLDGTLVQTEKLKATSYARVAVELRPQDLREEQVVEAFKAVVRLPRRDVAQRLVAMFNLEEATWARKDEFGVSAPWQAFVRIRLKHYEGMLADPEVIRANQWSHNLPGARGFAFRRAGGPGSQDVVHRSHYAFHSRGRACTQHARPAMDR